MATLAENVLGYAALASFDADAAAPKFWNQRGFLPAFVRNGVGDYSLTLQQPENMITDGIVTGAVQGATPGLISFEPVSTTVVRVRTTDAAGVALETDFWVEIKSIGPN